MRAFWPTAKDPGASGFVITLWVVSILVGLLLGAFTLPFQVADETSHFFRAYQLSEGALIPLKVSDGRGQTGGNLPRELRKQVNVFGPIIGNPQKKMSRHELLEAYQASRPLDQAVAADRTFEPFANTAVYSPVPYLPQSIAIAVSRALGLKILTAFYLARIAALLCSSFFLFLALRVLRDDLRMICALFMVTLTPMGLSQMASVSADSVTIGLACLTVGLSIALAVKWRRKLFWGLLVAAAALGLCKNVYFPIGFLGLIGIFRWHPRRQALRRSAYLVAAIFLPLIIWSAASGKSFSLYILDPAVDPAAQVKYVLRHPWQTLSVFTDTATHDYLAYRNMYIGVLGHLDTPVPNKPANAYWYVLLAVTLIGVWRQKGSEGAYRPKLSSAAFVLLLTYSLLVLLYLSMYLVWNPVGASRVEGIQGRYFVPIAVTLLLAIPVVVKVPRRVYLWACIPIFTYFWFYVQNGILHALGHRFWS